LERCAERIGNNKITVEGVILTFSRSMTALRTVIELVPVGPLFSLTCWSQKVISTRYIQLCIRFPLKEFFRSALVNAIANSHVVVIITIPMPLLQSTDDI
jgi:hypothetical protein